MIYHINKTKLEENIGSKLFDILILVLTNFFFFLDQSPQARSTKLNKWALHQTRNLFAQEPNGQPKEDICKSHPGKGLTSKIHEEFTYLNIKKQLKDGQNT